MPGIVAVILALAAVLAVLFVVLWFAPFIGRRMSETLRMIMTRLMGMIVAAIAVAMVIAGLQELIPILRLAPGILRSDDPRWGRVGEVRGRPPRNP